MSITAKKPISSGVAKVPIMMQLENAECGAICLAMILAYYGKWIPQAQLRSDCGVSRDGSNAKNIMIAAKKHDLDGNGYKYETEVLMEKAKFPCIIHWRFKHFVVLCGFKGNKAIINDPAKGHIAVPLNEFDEAFTGICLQFTPNENFKPYGKRKSIYEFVFYKIGNAKSAFIFTAIITLITCITGIISPAFTKIFVDQILTHESPSWLIPFTLCMCVVAAIQITAAGLQAAQQIKITSKLDAVSSASFLSKIIRLPMGFFEQRMPADIVGRYNSNADIAKNMIDTAMPLFLNMIMMVIYLIVMLCYSVPLACIGVISVAINAFTSAVVSKKLLNILRCGAQNRAKLETMTVSCIEKIESIKSSGGENGYFEQWASCLADVSNENTGFSKIKYRLGMLHSLTKALADIAVLGAGVILVSRGHFTVGMIMAFQVFLSSFSAPAANLIDTSQTIQEMRADVERIDDVMQYPEEPAPVTGCIEDDSAENMLSEKLSGHIEMKNIQFGYSKSAKPILDGFSMEVKQGQTIAIVGMSGCGKSTVTNLLAGFNKPWRGEILFDGKRMEEIDKAVFCGSLAIIDQEFVIFADTIMNNIKMWDNTIEDFEVIMAAKDADIHDRIIQRDGGYYSVILENGCNLSGGERQKIEIARALAQDPTIMVLDEATSALDAQTEKNVINAIKDRGVTCIMIAHRLSTIRDCDEILVLDGGRIAEKGTHDELLKLDGIYKQLVLNS